MIYRGDPPFIFVHIPKTGGTSIECVLCQYFLDNPLHSLSGREAAYYVLPTKKATHQHYKLRDYQTKCGADVGAFFSFAFVRNPWSLVASEIAFFKKYKHPAFSRKSFRECVHTILEAQTGIWGHDFSAQCTYLSDSSHEMGVNYVGRYERLQNDFNRVCDILNMPRVLLPTELCAGSDHYTTLYDDETKLMVNEHYAADINAFGYSFEG